MSTNKNAVIRYNALDQCFSNYGRRYYIEDLVAACNQALYDFCNDTNGVQRRQVFDDIRFMESEQGYAIPLSKIKDGKKVYYRYSDRTFSIKKQPLNAEEMAHLRETVLLLSRIKGLPNAKWIEDILAGLETMLHLHDVQEKAVCFDQNPYLQGLSHFSALFNAILHHQVLSIWYRAAFGPAEQYEIHPYHLKQYNTRWFLFGLVQINGADRIMNMAMDRIDSFKVLPKPYITSTIDFEAYFDNVFGVSIPEGEEPRDILLKVDKKRYPYIASKPIHHSQTVRGNDEHTVTIGLHLIPNYEFETLLLGFADSIEILQPAPLREKIRSRSEAILAKQPLG